MPTVGRYRPMIEFPIETERLLIRPLAPLDAEDLFGVFRDADVLEHLGVQPAASEEEVREVWLAPKIRQQEQHGISLWAVIERATGRVIGDCGLQPYRDTDEIELGGRGARAFWSKGLGFEAARACIEVARHPLGLERIVAETAPANIAAQRLIDKLGFQMTTRTAEGWPFYELSLEPLWT